MRMINRLVLAGIATISAGTTAGFATPIETVELTLQVTPNAQNTGGTFKVLEQNSDPTQTSGLAGLSFDVLSTGNVVVTGSTQKFPNGFDADSLGATGFDSPFKSNGSAGVGITNAQSNIYTVNNAGDVNSIFLGVGNMSESVPSGDDGSGDGGAGDAPGNISHVSVALPALLATGNYTGSLGSLMVTSSTTRAGLLPAVMPTPTASGVNVSTFSPGAVTGQTVPIGVPEPASLGLLAVGAGGLLLRRRR